MRVALSAYNDTVTSLYGRRDPKTDMTSVVQLERRVV